MSNLLLSEQAWWDVRQFDPALGYSELDTRDKKVLHILLHSVKAAGKLAVSKTRKVIGDEVIPDLAIYRSQLVNLFELDPSDMESYCEEPLTDEEIQEHLKPVFINEAKDSLTQANAWLAEYLELKQHGKSNDESLTQRSANQLHIVAARLAVVYEIDLEVAHRDRLEELLGEPIPDPFV